ncbi:MAG: integrase arm-type DNA-binding domain-containing protein [[Pasteurella] mairii]|uniref:Phage integrase family site-specific recombinase n=1 Tax=[Pasteurella] mairii TaxID=757 RepID=A0A379B827_9PAST|nr:integrase arm-type DNA-binding domain-containing protein [[Pasteurella] mairii]SUB34641.1 phage integrase family site-specific recombinase [[Pasteurella] mairii]
MARKIIGLTNTQVERSKHDPRGKKELNDGNGLFLELKPTGAKVWRFRYSHPTTNKRTKITIGNYPDITLAQARQQREEWRALLAQGINPQTHKARIARELELAEANTFLAIAQKWRAKKLGEIEEKTVRKYWGSLELHVLPFIGSYPITEIVPSLALVPLERVQARNNISKSLIR